MAETYHAFADPVQDKLLGLVLALGAELWVVKDRLALLEKVLEEKGTRVGESIDELARNPERVPAMESDRNAFMERFFRPLTQD